MTGCVRLSKLFKGDLLLWNRFKGDAFSNLTSMFDLFDADAQTGELRNLVRDFLSRWRLLCKRDYVGSSRH